MLKVTKNKTFIFTDLNNGNNKFWKIYEYDDGSIKTEWGPVGAQNAQSKNFAPYSKDFEKECQKKEKKGYKQFISAGEVPTNSKGNLKKTALEQIKTDSPKLIEELVQANIHQILDNTTLSYDTSTGLFSTDLGVVTKDSLDEARTLLSKIGKYIESGNKHTNDQTILNEYFMLVPQKLPRQRGRALASLAIPNMDSVKKQSSLLDSLEASLDVIDKGDNKISQKIFDTSLFLVKNAQIQSEIEKLFYSTYQKIHAASKLKPVNIYAIEIKSAQEKFESNKNIGNIQRLWHGSRISNVLSILSKGLIIPPANASYCTGRLYNNGIYFSDQSTKSLNYSYGWWAGQKHNRCFMFLSDVIMGKPYIPRGSYDGPFPKSGYDSVFAKAGQSGVMNNEMIVYSTDRCNLVYLVEFN